ncbi:MAG: single-stranded DNA-binding protein [Acidobacteriota bacterium]|jgi:single-strand DNA-binding protein|nr:single-stranded DNA-binding protein [Acidobacteriota bacterium]
MASLNKVILIGNLGKDPETRYTQSNQAVATFSLATTDNWTGADGNRQERTEWHRVVAWGKLADLCQRYLTKGRQVYVEGRIQSREWTDQGGNKRTTTEINASSILFLGNRNSQGGDYAAAPPYEGTSSQPRGGRVSESETAYPGTEPEQPFGEPGITDKDIPF